MAREPWEDCPPKARLREYAEGKLQGKFNEWTYRHLKFCGACLRRLSKVRRVPTPDQIITSGGIVSKLTQWFTRIVKRRQR